MRARRPSRAVAVALVAAAHFTTALASIIAGIPFRLEAWATIAGVAVAGPVVGAVGAVLSRIALALVVTDGPLWVAAMGSILTAVAAVPLVENRWLDIERPLRLVAGGLILGVVSAVFLLTLPALGVDVSGVSADTLDFRNRLADALAIDGRARVVERILLEVIDKTLATIVAAAILALGEERLAGVARGEAAPRTANGSN